MCFLDRARWMQIAVFFGSRALDANTLLIAKPPDDVRSAVTDRSRRVLEMDFGARDEAIGQELTEGGAFCVVAPRLCFLDRARWMQIPSL